MCFTCLGLESEYLHTCRVQTTAVVYIRDRDVPQAEDSAQFKLRTASVPMTNICVLM